MSAESTFFSEKTGLEEMLTSYFYAGFTYTEFLNVCHEHRISLSTLKRMFKALDLLKRPLIPWRATVEEVNNAVQRELDASGASLEYRRVWASLKSTHISTQS